jgi:peptide/nickel transport system substrate-binding protein
MKRLLAVLALAMLAFAAPSAHAQKDSVTLGQVLEPPHLDPTGSAAQAIREVTYNNIYEGLVRLDRDGKIQPGLAEKWEQSADGLSFTFHLQKGVTFHDGSPFSAADVKFTFDRAMAPDSTNAQKWIFAPIEAIDTPDPQTVVIKLKRVSARFLYGLAWGDAVIFSPKTVADNKTNPVGTGPYKFDRWVKGDRVEMSAYDGYWRKGAAKIRRAVVRFIPDPAAQVSALLAGDIDGMTNMGVPEAIDQIKKDPRFQVEVGATEGEIILAINNQKPPFNDVRVRRALSYAIDRKSIIDGAYSGYGTPIGSHFSPLHPAYVDLTQTYPHDVAKAKALLAEAGLANGLTATLKLPPPAYARRSGEIIAALLGEAGIKVTIEPIEFAQWLDQVFRRKEFDLTIIAHTEPLDIDIYSRDTYYFGYKNPAFNELIQRIDSTLDEKARNALYGDAQKMLAADAVNVFLFQLPKLGAWNKNLTGMWPNWPLPTTIISELSWK